MKLTLLANDHFDDDVILLEDVNDLLEWYEVMGRTVLRSRWASESIQAASRATNEAQF